MREIVMFAQGSHPFDGQVPGSGVVMRRAALIGGALLSVLVALVGLAVLAVSGVHPEPLATILALGAVVSVGVGAAVLLSLRAGIWIEGDVLRVVSWMRTRSISRADVLTCSPDLYSGALLGYGSFPGLMQLNVERTLARPTLVLPGTLTTCTRAHRQAWLIRRWANEEDRRNRAIDPWWVPTVVDRETAERIVESVIARLAPEISDADREAVVVAGLERILQRRRIEIVADAMVRVWYERTPSIARSGVVLSLLAELRTTELAVPGWWRSSGSSEAAGG